MNPVSAYCNKAEGTLVPATGRLPLCSELMEVVPPKDYNDGGADV